VFAGSSREGIIDDSHAVDLDSESGSVTASELSSEPISEDGEGPEVISGGGGSGSNQSAGSEVTTWIHVVFGMLQRGAIHISKSNSGLCE
jgi:hypothetical protein